MHWLRHLLSLRLADAGGRGTAWVLLPLLSVLCVGAAVAAPVLEQVESASLPGNQVQIDLLLSEATAPPETFATDSPARIALDFRGVKNGLAAKSIPINLGAVHSLAAVEAGERTRVVVNLDEAMPYQVTTKGNRVTVAVNFKTPRPSAGAGAGPPAASATKSAPATAARRGAAQASAADNAIRDIDFQRGASGEGRVLIRLPSADTRIAVREEGDHVVAELVDTGLPQRLLRRLDVTDFATPVVAIESRPKGGNVEVSIEAASDYDYLAYQTDDLFTLEFRALTPAEKEQLERRQLVYSGDRLSLNFQDIEVRAVLQMLADFTNFNLVASDRVTGNITLRLKNVPWDQALDIILKTKGLSKRQVGNVIMVAPSEDIAAQEKQELEAQQTIEELAPLRSEFMQVNYAEADKLVKIIKSENDQLLSERGNVTVDPRTNTLIVRDTAKNLEEIRGLIQRLDVPVRQVMIESRVVIANNDFARDLGVRFGFSRWQGNENSGKFNEITGGLPGYIDDLASVGPTWPGLIQNPETNVPLMVNLPAANPSGAVNFLIGKAGSYLLQLELSAMQTEGRGEIISNPRVITSDQNQATIKVGQQIPYQESAGQSGATSTSFKDAVLQLDVTPHITPDDRIIMDLKVNKDNPDFSVSGSNGEPGIATRQVQTKVLVDNGETVVLGGVFEQTKSMNREQVPWLGDLPVLGRLFRGTSQTDNNTELLIFVTPKILKSDLTLGAR
ncbi:type IV pilus secretin PilQ/competence protein [Thioflavicoccus mobilis 8321]|uniref:Type IV pilus secretin PilQ/competence protein n=1 Tax=Thioflavicoccus mobilis 8321 TaxID=765912 RepID=L0GT41_9GAMM|nr:type IV pilus secretin PilQ [Thioflavicoccus mobilis]AGA88962.1 type IV pilus secretin PilQ/competence protein [Thioflavicoccus mobilis 8321]